MIIPSANGAAIIAAIIKNITDIITFALLSRFKARTALKSSATVSITSDKLPPTLLPSSNHPECSIEGF